VAIGTDMPYRLCNISSDARDIHRPGSEVEDMALLRSISQFADFMDFDNRGMITLNFRL